MRKFQEFSVKLILRDMNFGESRSSKTAVFAILGALNFVNFVNFGLQNVQKFKSSQIQRLPISIMGLAYFDTLDSPIFFPVKSR